MLFRQPQNPGQSIGWVTKVSQGLGHGKHHRAGNQQRRRNVLRQRRWPLLLRPAKELVGLKPSGRALSPRGPATTLASFPQRPHCQPERPAQGGAKSTATAAWIGCVHWRKNPPTPHWGVATPDGSTPSSVNHHTVKSTLTGQAGHAASACVTLPPDTARDGEQADAN